VNSPVIVAPYTQRKNKENKGMKKEVGENKGRV
jgi:hypothetical protein